MAHTALWRAIRTQVLGTIALTPAQCPFAPALGAETWFCSKSPKRMIRVYDERKP
jgi:hypothetical protein